MAALDFNIIRRVVETGFAVAMVVVKIASLMSLCVGVEKSSDPASYLDCQKRSARGVAAIALTIRDFFAQE